MGKINFCDVCHPLKDFQMQDQFLKVGKVTVSKYRSSLKNRISNMRVVLDLCENHKDFLKGCKTTEEAQKKIETELWGWK